MRSLGEKIYLRKILKSSSQARGFDLSSRIMNNINELLNTLRFEKLGLYCAIFHEPKIDHIMMAYCHKILALPKIVNSEILFYKYSLGDNLQISKLGILETISCDAITPQIALVPALAFDKNGYRLGYGKGYYDRYFANQNSDIIKIGLCFEQYLFNIIPHEQHDVSMDYIVTENLILKIC